MEHSKQSLRNRGVFQEVQQRKNNQDLGWIVKRSRCLG